MMTSLRFYRCHHWLVGLIHTPVVVADRNSICDLCFPKGNTMKEIRFPIGVGIAGRVAENAEVCMDGWIDKVYVRIHLYIYARMDMYIIYVCMYVCEHVCMNTYIG